MFETENDPFADALERFWATGKGSYRYTREDGLSRREDVGIYFGPYRFFPLVEKRALKFVRGRVLDIGCGAGRHALYLQSRGFQVTAIDASPRVAAIASSRGVRDVRIACACVPLPLKRKEFDTVLLLGNNLGLCGSRGATGRMLRDLARVTRPKARILATTRAPGTFNPTHLNFWNRQLEAAKSIGVVRYRLDYCGKKPKWVKLLLLSPSELAALGWKCGWRVTRIIGDGRADEGYAAVMEKK